MEHRSAPGSGTPQRIVRWEAFGGTWEVSSVTRTRAVVELRRCDGGEIVETIESTDPGFVRWAAVQLRDVSGRAADG